jgi:hypothetical protein
MKDKKLLCDDIEHSLNEYISIKPNNKAFI